MNNPEYTLEYYQAKERAKSLKAHGYYLRKKYNVTPEQYKELLLAQNGLCAICKTTKPNKRLSVDHNHKTGNNRGLLCDRCNAGLGYFLDSEDMLQKAINYLVLYRE